MRIGKHSYAFERWPTVVVAALLPALLALGVWQLGRADEKRALLAAVAAAAAAPAAELTPTTPRYARVRARGRWDPRQVLLDAQVHRGQVGYRVLAPLVLADGTRLFVDRGWVAAPSARDRLPEVALAPLASEVDVEVEVVGWVDEFPRPGVTVADPPAGPAPSTASWPRVELYPSAAALAAALGAAVQPRLLRLDPAAPGGFVRSAAPTIGFTPERHLGYALTWFALAAVLVLLWLRLSRVGAE